MMNIGKIAASAADKCAIALDKTSRFLTKNGSLILTIAGVGINLTATSLAFYWGVKDQKERDFSVTPDEELAAQKKMKKHVIAVAAMSIAANAATVGGFIIDQKRISGLSKALVAAMNALPAAAVGVTSLREEDDLVGTEKVAAEKFSFSLSDLGFSETEIDMYGRLNDLNHHIEFLSRLHSKNDPITYNDLASRITNKYHPTDYGYTIGWRDVESIKWVYIGANGELLTFDEARCYTLKGLGSVRIMFTNLENLTDRFYKADGVEV